MPVSSLVPSISHDTVYADNWLVQDQAGSSLSDQVCVTWTRSQRIAGAVHGVNRLSWFSWQPVLASSVYVPLAYNSILLSAYTHNKATNLL